MEDLVPECRGQERLREAQSRSVSRAVSKSYPVWRGTSGWVR